MKKVSTKSSLDEKEVSNDSGVIKNETTDTKNEQNSNYELVDKSHESSFIRPKRNIVNPIRYRD